MDPNVKKSWEDFLNPDVTRGRLSAASIYIASFEALKDCIVDRIRDFFCTGFNQSGEIINPRYQSHVLSRNRSPLYASLDWLKELNVIDDVDVEVFERAKACRNKLAHELFSAVSLEGLPSNFDECFADMVALLNKIEVWWIVNVEIPTSPDMDDRDIDEGGIIPGSIMTIKLLQDVALGDEEQSWFYYNEFRRRTEES